MVKHKLAERDYEYIKVYKPKKIRRKKSFEHKHQGGLGIFKSPEQKFKERLAQTRALEQKRKLEKLKREFEVESRERKAKRQQESRQLREARIAKLKQHSGTVRAFANKHSGIFSRKKKSKQEEHQEAINRFRGSHPYGGFESAKQ